MWQRHRGGAASGFGGPTGTFLPPREDINAPDMYLPIMAFVTWILLIALKMGFENMYALLAWVVGRSVGWLVGWLAARPCQVAGCRLSSCFAEQLVVWPLSSRLIPRLESMSLVVCGGGVGSTRRFWVYRPRSGW